jgi:hypothetical protein
MSGAKCTFLPMLAAAIFFGGAYARAAEPTAHLLDEPPLAARLAGIDREWNLSFAADGKVRVVPAKDLATWGRYRDASSGPQILLAGGGVIRADVLKLDDDSLVLGDATGLGRGLWEESTLPRNSIQAVLFQPPAGALSRDRLHAELAAYEGGEDRLLLIGGESVRGQLVAAPLDGRFLPADVKPSQGTFSLIRRGADDPLEIPAAKVVALSLAAVSPPPRPAGTSAWLGCRDGSLVHAMAVEAQGGAVTLRLAGGGSLLTTLAGREDPQRKFWDDVALVQPLASRVIWLSDVKPLGYKHIPFLSIEWPYATDQGTSGGRLRAGGATFRKGLGMHTASRLAYDVTGYRTFEAELALDESAGTGGSVIFKVLLQSAEGNWTPAYESPVLRGGDPPTPISIPLRGTSRLALLVEFADRGDTLDHANWLNARLIK